MQENRRLCLLEVRLSTKLYGLPGKMAFSCVMSKIKNLRNLRSEENKTWKHEAKLWLSATLFANKNKISSDLYLGIE